MIIEEAFANMDVGMKAIEFQENMTYVEVNNLINEINLRELGADTMESRMEELRKQHAGKIREYQARFFYLKNQVPTLTMGEAGSSSSTPIAPTNINLQYLQTERDTTLEEVKIAKSQALEVCTTNQVMLGKMEALQKEVVDMQQQLQMINEVVVDHKAKLVRWRTIMQG
jgi:hypothetical protein